jgi:hypothetical protein
LAGFAAGAAAAAPPIGVPHLAQNFTPSLFFDPHFEQNAITNSPLRFQLYAASAVFGIAS